MPIQNWRLAMNWFTIRFDDRLKDHLQKMELTQNNLQGLWKCECGAVSQLDFNRLQEYTCAWT